MPSSNIHSKRFGELITKAYESGIVMVAAAGNHKTRIDPGQEDKYPCA